MNSNEIILEHLNRAQTESRMFMWQCFQWKTHADPSTKKKHAAWIDLPERWKSGDYHGGWEWFKKGKAEFLWVSEKDGWRHMYRVAAMEKRKP
jgi:dipeptidyl-peptidase-4